MQLIQQPILKINDDIIFNKKFTFCTLVTRYEEYMEMVQSAQQKGFVGDDVEFLYFDNKNSNKYDGYSGINKAIRQAEGEFLIFCHQDIIFHDDNRHQLEGCLSELEMKDPNWAVAGNAGIKNDSSGQGKVRITDPNQINFSVGDFPEQVVSVDENFIVINRKHSFSCSSNLFGFHFYGLDLCQNAKELGLNTYVINFHLLHKSAGKLDTSFYESKKEYIKHLQKRKKSQIIRTTCTHFYVSSSVLFNWIFSFETFFRKKNRFNKLVKRFKAWLNRI